MEEIWKDIAGYEGLYQASNLGRIKSFHKSSFEGPIILKSCYCRGNYKQVCLSKKGKSKMHKVHKLVYESFYGATTLQIDHIIEHDKDNNHLSNLQVLTRRENISKNRLTLKKSSLFTGVCWEKRRNLWLVNISINRQRKHIGYFKNEIDAHNMYQFVLSKLHLFPENINKPISEILKNLPT